VVIVAVVPELVIEDITAPAVVALPYSVQDKASKCPLEANIDLPTCSGTARDPDKVFKPTEMLLKAES
jgi:hypothetical protein